MSETNPNTANQTTETPRTADSAPEQPKSRTPRFGFSVGAFGRKKTEEYPHEYLVTRESDWVNPTLYESWLQEQMGKSLRFKQIKVHSDIPIPQELNKKILKELFTKGVGFDRRYFSGVKESVNTALLRFKTLDVFDYAAVNLSKGLSGMQLSLYLKGKPAFDSSTTLRPSKDSVIFETEHKARNFLGRLETATLKTETSLLDLDSRSVTAEVSFPLCWKKYNLRTFGGFEVQPISSSRSFFGVRDTQIGAQLEDIPCSSTKHAFGVAYQHKSFIGDSWLSQQVFGRAEPSEVSNLRTRFPDLQAFGPSRGGRVYYNYETSALAANRFFFGDSKSIFRANGALLLGNSKGLELGLTNQSEKIVTGLGGPKLNTSRFLIQHLISAQVRQSFDSNQDLLVNSVFHTPDRISKPLDSRSPPKIEPLALTLHNQLKVTLTDASTLDQRDASSWFLYGSTSLNLAKKPRGVTEQRVRLNLGFGKSWHLARQKTTLNFRVGLFDQNGFAPMLSLDSQDI